METEINSYPVTSRRGRGPIYFANEITVPSAARVLLKRAQLYAAINLSVLPDSKSLTPQFNYAF